MPKVRLKQLAQDGAVNRDVIAWNSAAGEFQPAPARFTCCPFGGKSDSLGAFLIANGKSSDNDDSSKPKTRQPAPSDGNLVGLAYVCADGDTSTQMKIHINGVVQQTLTLANISSGGGLEALSVSVSEGDQVELEYDAAQKPGQSTWMFLIERV